MARYPLERLRGTVPQLAASRSLVKHLLLALLLVVLLAMLRIWGPQESLKASRSSGPSASGSEPAALAMPATWATGATSGASSDAGWSIGRRRFVLAGDTINGEPLVDAMIVQRIERIAASVPADLLSVVSREPHVRYMSQAFGASDDAPVYYGVFREPAAALAFGCALDEALDSDCKPVPLLAGAVAYEDPPGVQCQPMRIALGAPVYEPDRCEAGS